MKCNMLLNKKLTPNQKFESERNSISWNIIIWFDMLLASYPEMETRFLGKEMLS